MYILIFEGPQVQNLIGFSARNWLQAHGRSLFYFTTFTPVNTVIFDFKMGLFLVPTVTDGPPVFIHTVVLAVVRAVRPLDFIFGRSNF